MNFETSLVGTLSLRISIWAPAEVLIRITKRQSIKDRIVPYIGLGKSTEMELIIVGLPDLIR